jgi:hypothetical protein
MCGPGGRRGGSAAEAGIYPPNCPPANIITAMNLVPDEVRSFFDLVTHNNCRAR